MILDLTYLHPSSQSSPRVEAGVENTVSSVHEGVVGLGNTHGLILIDQSGTAAHSLTHYSSHPVPSRSAPLTYRSDLPHSTAWLVINYCMFV